MGRFLIIDAHDFRLQNICVEVDGTGRAIVLETQEWLAPCDEHVWMQQFPRMAQKIQADYPTMETVFIVPSAWCMHFIFDRPEKTRWSLYQIAAKELYRQFRLSFNGYVARVQSIADDQLILHLMVKKRLAFVGRYLRPHHCVNAFAGYWGYLMRTFNYWPTILLFREVDGWYCFVYSKQGFQYAAIQTHSANKASIEGLQKFIVHGLQIPMEDKRITLVGDLHPELAELCRSELNCQVITDLQNFEKNPSVRLPATTQAMVDGFMDVLRHPQQALQAVDIALPKQRLRWLHFDDFALILVKKLVFGALLVGTLGFLIADGVLFQQIQNAEAQLVSLQQIQTQRQQIQGRCRQWQEENAARTFWPQLFLSVVQVLQTMEEACCIDDLRIGMDKNEQSLLLIRGRVAPPAERFRENVKARLMELQPPTLRTRFSMTLQRLPTGAEQFTVQMPMAVPKILQSK